MVFVILFQMPDNPWLIENIQKFLFLNCPECEFKTKKENSFQDHAVERHPSSFALFNNVSEYDPLELDSWQKFKKIKTENFELEDLQNEETLEEIMFPEERDTFDGQLKPSKSKVLNNTKSIKDKTKNDKSNNEGRKVFHLCSFCKRSFRNMVDLKIHIKRHQNVLPMAMIGRVS